VRNPRRLLCERLGFIFQLNETGITLQGFFETGRKFARKALLAEFLQAQKIVDVTMVRVVYLIIERPRKRKNDDEATYCLWLSD
jgi:hypothetical protein